MEKATKKARDYVGAIQIADSVGLLDKFIMFETDEFVFMELEEQRYVVEQLDLYFNSGDWRILIPDHLVTEKERKWRENKLSRTVINSSYGRFTSEKMESSPKYLKEGEEWE